MKICGDIQKERLITGVNYTSNNWKNLDRGSFSFLDEMPLGCCLHSYNDFFDYFEV
jgi:hypothetical protein